MNEVNYFVDFRLSQAHAKLMFREEVTVQDAIITVALVESSMQSTALIGQVNVLHTSFPKNPVDEYAHQGTQSKIDSFSIFNFVYFEASCYLSFTILLTILFF